ncbi:hypothetical protein [Hymenobacter cavernae]|uniref:Uncharacterized protein n=1 Tax=Hymenobacter cavernae TaxID=2044852 RepID=A0ABQ1TZL6_9BACT|nr:hypothetical protein [Hymenobacter cavernae]GGF06855.1 hypothetical protein GCM10011383_17350 [Hymenobacter cavernae]
MHASNPIPLLRSLAHGLAYVLFQLALVLAYVLHSAGSLRSPFRAGEETAASHSRRVQPRPWFWSRPLAG